jgi:hypothetical protein
MGFLGKIFGKSSSSGSKSAGGRISMAAMTLQQNYKVSAQRCGIDGKTFPCPSVTHTIISGDINGFALDVGGYCGSCRAFRCHDHVEFKPLEPMAYGIFCTVCGSRVSGVGA